MSSPRTRSHPQESPSNSPNQLPGRATASTAVATKARRPRGGARNQAAEMAALPAALPEASGLDVGSAAKVAEGGRARPSDSEKLTINLGAVDLGSIDLLVAEGFFSNRSDLIRTAVRNLLAGHRDIIQGALARQERTLGLRRITRGELEALRKAGDRVRIGVVGLAIIDDDVPPELAQQTIAHLSVLGSLQASTAVRKALAGKIG